MHFDIIKETTGKASEYAPFVVDLYEKRKGRTEPIEDALDRLIKDAAWLKENRFNDEILLCFETDPYPPDYECHTITREAIQILDNNELKYVILTEYAMRAISDFGQLKHPENTKLILKIASIPHDTNNENQTDEEFMGLMFSPLNDASKKGIKVWIELNSAADPALSLQLIYRLHPIVNGWKVGEHSYKPKTESKTEWKKFIEDAKAKGFFKNLGKLSALNKYEINNIEGNPRLLLIAPHGIATEPKDDINTDKLTLKIAERIKCRAIVNNVISRLYLDLNKVDEAKKHKKFISTIEKVVKTPGRTLVIWIHGIDEDNLKDEIQTLGVKKNIQCLIGCGQPDKPTAKQKTIDDLIRLFEDNSIIACVARNGSNYCGHNISYMNQWFRSEGHKLTDVQSVQLEFKLEGIRRPEDLDEASKNIANALSGLVNLPISVETELEYFTEPEDPLVVNAFEYLKELFKRHFHVAMLEAGRYLIKTFYGNIKDAKNNTKPLLPLIKKFQANSGKVPSKTWVYDAVKLAIDEHDFKDFRTYGNLGHSQKVLLTHVDINQDKRKLVEEAFDGNYTVVRLRERIREIKVGHSFFMSSKSPTIYELKKLEPTQLIGLQEVVQKRINKLYDQLNLNQKSLEKISSVLNQTEMVKEVDQKAKCGF